VGEMGVPIAANGRYDEVVSEVAAAPPNQRLPSKNCPDITAPPNAFCHQTNIDQSLEGHATIHAQELGLDREC
jgi:hypothetical protein